MNAGSWLRSAAVCSAVVVFGICWLLVPALLWTNPSMVAAALLSLSIPLPMFIVGAAVRRPGQDASAIWSIGPGSVYSGLLLATAAASLAWAVCGATTLMLVAALTWAGVALVGWLLLRASADLVTAAASLTGSAAADPRTRWAGQLRRMELLSADGATRALVAGLGERVRFAANENASLASSHAEAISGELAKLEASLSRADEAGTIAAEIIVLLEERESSLRAAKSRA